MIEMLKGLQEAIAEELRVQRELFSAGARKRDALVGLDVRAVDQATQREHQILVALATAGERRLRRTAETSRLLGIPDAEASVTRIAERVGEPWRATLLARAAELRKAIQETARVTGANLALTEQSLDYVQRFFRIIGGVKDDVTYTRRGVEARPEIPKLMIDEVV